jgi:hypothetical protein
VQEKVYICLPDSVKRVGTSAKDASQQLTDLSEMEDVVVAPDPTAVNNMPEVC